MKDTCAPAEHSKPIPARPAPLRRPRLRPALVGRRIRGLLIAATLGAGTSTLAADLTIEIAGVKEERGQLRLAVLRNEEQLAGKESAETALVLPARAGARVTLHNLPAGTYGIQVMQDLNSNNKLDSNVVGIPREPWAFSNNATGRFGPPKWESVQFELGDEHVVQSIRLNH